MIVTFLSGYLGVLMFLKTDIDIDIADICLMFGSEEDRGKGGSVGANISKQSPVSPSLRPSVVSLAWLLLE